MPPFNEARRDRLADAAIELLAREGVRGLTHRAVDAEAHEPPGTTSRYFRTREALTRGVVERIRQTHFDDLTRASAAAAHGADVVDALVAIVHSALTLRRPRHLAMLELFLESNRRPDLRASLIQTRTIQRALIQGLYRAAGIELGDRQTSMLVNAITGIIFTALTSSQDAADVAATLELTRETIDTIHALTLRLRPR